MTEIFKHNMANLMRSDDDDMATYAELIIEREVKTLEEFIELEQYAWQRIGIGCPFFDILRRLRWKYGAGRFTVQDPIYQQIEQNERDRGH
jgi:hypothetical protein